MAENIFKRKIYGQMVKWKEESEGRTALLIKGARRVGKSTIVREFVQREYETYIYIDFSAVSKEISELFDDISDLDYFFLRLQLLFHVDLHERRSAIVFDEVQEEPRARQAIKHLVADHRYDYIETGSLLSIRKNIKDIVIPSEETRLTLYPMDYEEFRWALGDTTTIGLIQDAFREKKPLGDAVNRKLMRDFRLYMLVGGMPQAVEAYLDTNNLGRVDQVKRSILELYGEDFRKADPSGRAGMIFKKIPLELSKNAHRFQISAVDPKLRADRTQELIADMLDSMTVDIAYHADDPDAGLFLAKDPRRYKLFLADTGLLVTLAFMDQDFSENGIYAGLLSDKLPSNLGYIYENMVAQMLRASGNELFYYSMPSETSHHSYEIDFLLSRGDKICPIEVKSSGYRTHKPLDLFSEKYQARIADEYLVYTKDLKKDQGVFLIPIYMVPFL